jgi:hypothetical protein
MNFKFFTFLCGLVLVYGCAYFVPSTVSPAVIIHSFYKDKITGTVILAIDDNVKNASLDVKATGYFCRWYKFPVTLDSSFNQSVKITTDAIFEKVVEQDKLSTQDPILQMGGRGIIYVKLNRFNPKITFSQGFRSIYAHASCDIVLDVTIKDANYKNLFTTTVEGSHSVDGDGGAFCRNGANLLSEAISLAMREAMERYGEWLTNSERIRTSFKQITIIERQIEK